MADSQLDKHARILAGNRRLMRDIHAIDRGLEHAEAIVHEHRQASDRAGRHDDRDDQALDALDTARALASHTYDLADTAADLGISLRHANTALIEAGDRMPYGIRLRVTIARDQLAEAVPMLDALRAHDPGGSDRRP